MFTVYSGRTKYSACVSKLGKLSEQYICPQKTQKALVFLFERFWAGEWFKVLANVKIHKIFLPEMHLNWHIQKMYIFGGEMPIKCFKKINLKKKLKGFFLGHNKLILRSNFFLPCQLKFMCCFKVSHFSTEQNPVFFSSFCSFKSQLFTKENIWNFNHRYLCLMISCSFGSRNRRKLFAATPMCRRRKCARTRLYLYSKCTFLAAKWKLPICACVTLCALQDHLSEQKRAFWWFYL